MENQTFDLIARPRLLAGGISDRDIRAQVTLGSLRRYWRGQYGAAADDDAQVYLRTVLAAAAVGEPGRVVLHHSAAVLHGLPLLGRSPSQVHFTTADGTNGSVRACQVHSAPLQPHEIVTVDGVRLTSPARTAVDVARFDRSFPGALAILDGALRSGVSHDELVRTVAAQRRWKGIGTAREALSHADGAAESAGESFSRALMIDWPEIPAPVLQPRIVLDDGSVAYADFGWFHEGRLVLVGEFDGKVKYGSLLRPGESATDAVVREKVREDSIRAQGIAVIRWMWADLLDEDRLRPLIRAALTQVGLIAA